LASNRRIWRQTDAFGVKQKKLKPKDASSLFIASPGKFTMNCFFCKKSGHTVYQCPTCPPCAHCKKKGHKSAACHQKPRLVYRTPKPVVPVVLLSLDDDDEPPPPIPWFNWADEA